MWLRPYVAHKVWNIYHLAFIGNFPDFWFKDLFCPSMNQVLNLFIHLPICLFVQFLIHSSSQDFIHSFFFSSVRAANDVCIHPVVHETPIHPSIHLSIHPSIHPFSGPPTHLSTQSYIRLPIHSSIHLSIHPSTNAFWASSLCQPIFQVQNLS